MTDYLTLAVACVGVGGTIISPLVSQQSLLRLRKADEESRRHDRVDEREYLKTKEYQMVRESIYVELNSKSRSFRGALRDVWESLNGDRSDDKAIIRMERARDDFVECQARAMIQVPDSVLVKVLAVSEVLINVYEILSRKNINAERLNNAGQALLDPSYVAIHELLNEMRRDLGVSDSDIEYLDETPDL
jgi:hypothetical protein